MTDTTTKIIKIPSSQFAEVERFVAEQNVAGARVFLATEQPSLSRRLPLGETHWVEIIVSAATAALTKELVSEVKAFLKRPPKAEIEKTPDDKSTHQKREQRDDV